jgi:anti-anti-sigma regulatory factor
MDSTGTRRHNPDTINAAWDGPVTWRETSGLREELFGLLDASAGTSVRLDVRGVTSIDRFGTALLVGARNRAAASGRTFVLVDSAGVVSQALSRLHLLTTFLVTEVVHSDSDLAVIRRPRAGLRRGDRLT